MLFLFVTGGRAEAIRLGRVRERSSRQVRAGPTPLSRALPRSRALSRALARSRRPDARVEVGGGPDQLALGALELDLVGRPPLGRPLRLTVVPGGSEGSEVSV
eukprot:scaffold85157_cov69-Phaeocystis_antarctica.AAC.4